jgi:type II secretory pathway component GspD/PulD (secretin)
MCRWRIAKTEVTTPLGWVRRWTAGIVLTVILGVGLPALLAEDPPRPAAEPANPARPVRSRPNKPADTPAKTPGQSRPRKAATQPAAGKPATPEPPPAGSLDSAIDATYEQMLKPAEERKYSISIQNGTYADLLDAFARMTGLALLGDAPAGNVTYVSTEEMDYRAALSRMRKILFNHPENFYIWRKGNTLEVFRITELQRRLPPDRVYTSVGKFEEAELDDMEALMLLYSPEAARVADLESLRDHMPDYVRIAPYSDKNAVTILALAQDVRKYLDLVKIFVGAADDPREFKGIPIRYVVPTYAVEMLHQFMPGLTEGGAAPATAAPAGRPSRGAPPPASADGIRARGIDLIPYDAVKKLYVRAMPDRITEIESYLAIIDVDAAATLGAPTIIELKHTRVEQLLAGLRPFYALEPVAQAQPQPQPPADGKRKRPAPAPVAHAVGGDVIVTDAIAIYPNPVNNTLMVMGEEEEITKLRMYISLLDIPKQEQTVRIPVDYADPEALAALVTELAPVLDPGAAAGVVVKASPEGGSLLVVGNPQAVELVRGLVKDLDQAPSGGRATVHTYRCQNAEPSAMIGLLTSLDQEGGGPAPAAAAPAPAPAPAGQPAPGKTSRPRRAVAKATQGGTRYIGDDATNLLYVICTETEWETDYLPILKSLDESAKQNLNKEVVAVKNGDTDKILESVRQALAAGGQPTAAPTMLPHPQGILVVGASPAVVEQIRGLVTEFDVDPQVQRRTFTLKYAEPNEVKTVLEALVVQTPGPRAAPRSAPKAQPGQPQPQPQVAPAAGGAPAVQIVLSGRKDLIVVAPEAQMTEIAGLIAELDVDPLNITVKVYDFPVGCDVGNLAQTLASLYPGGAAAPVVEQPKGQPPRPRPAAVASAGDVRFIPLPTVHKIMVSAPAAMLADIEEKIALLTPKEGSEGATVEFFEVHYIDPQTLAGVLEPLLQTKLEQLVATGAVPEPPAGGKGPAAKAVSVTPDPRGDRVIVVAPAPLFAEVRTLIERLDRPDRERVMKTVALEKADPKEMVNTIRTMLSARPMPTSAPARGGARGGARPPQSAEESITVVEAPGGSGIVLNGYEADVLQVEKWIKELDAAAKGGRDLKIYTPKNVGVEEFADMVMALLDSGGGAVAAKPKEKDEGLFGGSDWGLSSGGPRRGKDIYLVTDTWKGTMLVSATPSKLKEIDDLYAKFEGGPNGEKPLGGGEEPQPYEIYTLKYRERAYDAVWDIESYIDALWPGKGNKPKIDYIPFSKDVIIKCRPEDVPKVIDIIVKYVDKPSDKKVMPQLTSMEVVQPSGITAEDLARLVAQQIGPDKVKVVDLRAQAQAYQNNIEEIKPCVLPVCAVQWMSAALGEAAAEPAQPTTQPANLNSPAFNSEEEKLKQDLQRRMAGQGPAAAASQPARGSGPTTAVGKPPAATSQPAPSDEPPPPEEPLTIAPDNEKGVLVIKGPKDQVTELKDVVDKMLEELAKVPQPPDIRVFRVKYVDVNTATDVLEAMFNAPRQRGLTPQQIQQMQQMQALQAAQQKGKAGQPQAPTGAEDEKGDKGKGGSKRPKEGAEAEQPQPAQQQQESGQIRVYPDARTHTLIIRASPEQYPPILKLLATIDKKGTAADFRIYVLKRLNAAEVEEKLRVMLGLDNRSVRAVQRQPNQPGRQPVPQQNPQGQPIEFNMDVGGESLSLTGAERVTISSNPATNSIMAMAPEKTLDLIEQLITQLEEQEVPQVVTKTYEMKHADAADVATQLEKTFTTKGTGKASEGYDPSDVNRPTFIADTRTNTLTVRALELDLPKIEPLIEQFDRESPDDKPKYIKLQFAKPSEVAKKLQEAFAGAPGQGKAGKKSKIQVTGDDGSMQLIVVAPKDTFDDLQEMVAKLDVERTNLEFRIYPLTYARSPELLKQMSELMRTLLATGKGAGVDLGVFSAVADESTNSLVVAGEPTIFPIVKTMLDKIDIQPPESAAVETRVYRLVSAQADDVANTINRLFGQVRKAGIEPAHAESNPSTNTVLVRGTKAQQEEIWNQVIKPLDDFAVMPLNLKQDVIDLKFAKADDVATYLNDWFKNQQQALRTAGVKAMNPADWTVSITPEVASNKLLVLANDKNIELIRQRVAAVDTKDFGDLSARVTKPYTLANADPNTVAGIIGRQFQPTTGKVAEKDRVDAAAEGATQRIVVTASVQNHEKIAALIEELDKDSDVTRPTHVIELHKSDAAAATRSLQEMFVQGKTGGRGQQTISISNPQGSNTLLIRANDKELAEIQAVIDQMEAAGPAGAGEIKIIPLKFTDAEETRTILEEYLRKPGAHGSGRGGGSGADLVGDLRISVSTQNNSLILSGSAEQLTEVADVVAKIDVEVEGAGNIPKIIKLEHAQASAIQPQLEELFKQQPGGKVRGSTPGVAPVIVADDNSNAIIVRANPADFNAIDRLVKDLDSKDTAGAGIRIVRVAPGVNLDDLAALLEESFNPGLKQMAPTGRGGRAAQQLVVTVDKRTNSLVLAGAPSLYDDIEATIRVLEKGGPTGGRVTRIVQLKNTSASDAKTIIQDMTEDNKGAKSPSRGSGSRGGRPR